MINSDLIKWIFFDVGGVLLDESQAENRRIEIVLEVAKEFKPQITKEEVVSFRPLASEMVGGLSPNLLKLLLKDGQSQEAIQELQKHSFNYYELTFLRPEATQVIPQLAAKYSLGLMANQGPQIKQKLKDANLLKYFSHSGVSNEYNLHKPEPEFFTTILAETKTSPATSVLIDDNIERGLAPAKKLGLNTVWYKNNNRDALRGVVDLTINSLEDLLKIF